MKASRSRRCRCCRTTETDRGESRQDAEARHPRSDSHFKQPLPSSLRTQGPIPLALVGKEGSDLIAKMKLRAVWVPAFAGTTGCDSSFSRHTVPEFYKLAPPQKEGRREDRVRAAPAVSCAMCIKRKRTRAYRFSGSSPAFPAQRFYGLFRA